MHSQNSQRQAVISVACQLCVLSECSPLYPQSCLHAHTRANTVVHVLTSAAHIHTCTCTHMHTHARTHTHTCKHAYIRTHTHTIVHMHTHMPLHTRSCAHAHTQHVLTSIIIAHACAGWSCFHEHLVRRLFLQCMSGLLKGYHMFLPNKQGTGGDAADGVGLCAVHCSFSSIDVCSAC